GVDETEKPAMMGGSLHGKTLRRIEVQRRQLPLHEGLTRMKSLLIWPARFAENLRVETKRRQPPRKQGVDGKKKPAIMGGSLRRKQRS
ncbi:hypothetical protein LLE67_21545, partial [Xanthomonas campestris]|uniref:hypothetical protein n=1 Tax=Xanthomonas campestris TaxID=339 RepID=UPI001E54179A